MGIKTNISCMIVPFGLTLKNLPTTWGLRHSERDDGSFHYSSEKPPHHMGIKTIDFFFSPSGGFTLKNLPTTWGLRLYR